MSLSSSSTEDRSLARSREIDHCLEQFQAALHRGSRPPLDDYLPASSAAAVVLVELVHIELEHRLKQGEAARVEEYLARYPALTDDAGAVLDLVVAEYMFRRRGDLSLDGESFLRRFPAHREALAARLPSGEDEAVQSPARVSTPADDITLPTRTGCENGTGAGYPRVPGYEILGELGWGSMGIVYKARQRALNRLVALKTLPMALRGDGVQRGRFRNEVETIARIQHPNIVQVHDVGEREGQPFFVMEFVEGGNLADHCGGQPQAPRAAAEMVETLARAMEAVHAKGIVHRDLKPSNVLLGADGRLKVSDFGLARHEASNLTASGEMLGTPSYMAPEQAAGKVREVGPRADVYALGAIFFELLTGRPPFRGATVMEVLRQVQDAEPVPPRRLEPRIPRDVETICLKCLRKAPASRYAGARELADDLRRFLDGEAVRARPPAWPERVGRWVRRRPAAAGLLLALLLLALGIPLALVGHTLQLQEVVDREQKERDRAEQAGESVRLQEEEARLSHYAADVQLAHKLFKIGDVFQLPALLEPYRPSGEGSSDFRDFGWRLLHRHSQTPRPPLATGEEVFDLLAYTPDGRSLVIGGAARWGDSTLTVWDRQDRRPRFGKLKLTAYWPDQYPITAAYAPGGALLAGRRPAASEVSLWDVSSGQEKARLPQGGESMAFSTDGRRLAICWGNGTTIRDCVTGRRDVSLPVAHGRLLFSSDGNTLIVGSYWGAFRSVQWWDAATGSARGTVSLPHHLRSLASSPRGTYLLLIDGTGEGAIWDAAQRTPLYWSGSIGRARSLAVSADEQSLAVGGADGVIQLWDIPSARPRARYHWQANAIVQLAFSPDNRTLAAATADGAVHELDATVRHVPDSLPTTPAVLGPLAWSPDGHTVAAATRGGTVHLWDASSGRLRRVVRCPVEDVSALAFAPDGRTLATVCPHERFVRLWDAADGRAKGVTASGDTPIKAIAFSPNGQWLVRADGKTVRFWSLTSGQEGSVLETDRPVTALVFAANGRRLIAGGSALQVWQVGADGSPSSEPLARFPIDPDVKRLALSHAGRQLAVADRRGAVHLWRLTEAGDLPPQTPQVLPGQDESLNGLQFSPDDRAVFFFVEGLIAVWELSPRNLARTLYGPFLAGTLAPDGRSLAATGADGKLRLWDCKDWRLRNPRGQSLSAVLSLCFASEDGTLCTASKHLPVAITGRRLGVTFQTTAWKRASESLRFWDVGRGHELDASLPARDVMALPDVLASSPRGQWLAAGAEDGSVRIWDAAKKQERTRLFVSDKARRYAESCELARGVFPTKPEYGSDTEGISALAFSPNGLYLAAAGSRGSFRVWQTEDWRECCHWREPDGSSPWLAFTPDNNSVAGSQSGQIRIWNARTGELRTSLGVQTDSSVHCGAFVPGRDDLAFGLRDGVIRLWNWRTGQVKQLPTGHQGRITSLAFTPDGKSLASASWDHTVRLWNLAAGREIAVLEGHKGRVNAVAFSPDGKTLASGGEMGEYLGEVLLWR